MKLWRLSLWALRSLETPSNTQQLPTEHLLCSLRLENYMIPCPTPRHFRVIHVPLDEVTEPEDGSGWMSRTSMAIRRAVARAVVLYRVTEDDIEKGVCHLTEADVRDLGGSDRFRLATDFGRVDCRAQRGITSSVLCLTTRRAPLDPEGM